MQTIEGSTLTPKEFAEACFTLAARFEQIVETYGEQAILDFDASRVRDTACGTVACHAGWAQVMLEPTKEKELLYYSAGSDLLAQQLGFSNVVDQEVYVDHEVHVAQGVHVGLGGVRLSEWADLFPSLWGNTHGRKMFIASGWQAFGFGDAGECTLLDIAKHWHDVGDRVLAKYEVPHE